MKKNAFGVVTKTSANVPSEPAKRQLIDVRKLLLEEKSEQVVKKMLMIALDDAHPGQMQAIKMAVDRMLPMSEFEKATGGGKPVITINISGVNDPVTIEGSNEDTSDRDSEVGN